MALNSGLSPNTVKTALDKVFYGSFEYQQQPGIATATDPLVFNQDTIDRRAAITEQYQGPGYFDETGESEEVHESTVRTGNQQTHTVIKFARQLKIPRDYFDDELHNVVDNSVARLGRNGRLSRDRKAFKVFVDNTTTGDGVALVSNSHTTLSGDTVDNLITGDLTPTTMESMINSLLEQKTQDGTLGGFVPSVLLVPPALFKTAIEITRSKLEPDTADNQLNYISEIYPGMAVKQNPFLGATHGGSDTSAWLLSEGHSVMRWEREAINTHLVDWTVDEADRYVYKARFREVVSPISYEGIVGLQAA